MDVNLHTWLRDRNAEFRRNGVTAKQRPWIAWEDWATFSGESLSLNDDVVKEIFSWFERNTKAGAQYIRPLYVGAYYYDCEFWPVVIPVVAGRVRLDARESLRTMPDAVAASLFKDRDELMEFMLLWGNCLDYGFGIEEAQSTSSGFAKELFISGHQRLEATVSLLLQDPANPSSLESSRMCTEIFLKAYLAMRAGLTDGEAKRIRHDLAEAVNRCLAIEPTSELQLIVNNLNVFPDAGERYKGTEQPLGILWKAYEIAQFTGATVCRSLTGRNVRTTMRIR